ncbi:hypothetical protein [Motilimonas eburnea]|uniref:hypothetical protein n=1 Tax=Motilimonas eburnea TaxID=1737488 RepID=UPI001E2E3BE7|nr:hypothetical protein [Motilimonas eburnea]MCE2573899.1 hypothetical protein [Motilimonas eburnea]
MVSQAELKDQKTESLATKFIKHTFYVRIATMVLGFTMSAVLIILGYMLTQQDIEVNKGVNVNNGSEITADFGTASFALKNTAPGLLLILCGTIIAVSTIRKETFTKSQWADHQNGLPGFTESKG